MTRAEEGKLYRQRKREQMGEAAFKADEARKRRERRAASRVIPVRPNPPPIPQIRQVDEEKEVGRIEPTSILDVLYEAKKAHAEAKGHTIKKESVKTALDRIQRLHKYMTGATFTEFDWVRDTAKVSEFIENCDKWKTAESKLQQFQGLASILRVLDCYQKEYKFYSDKSVTGRKQQDEVQGENKLTDREKENFLPWSQLQKVNKNNDLSVYEAALVGVYTLIPPRRSKDFGLMKITTSTSDLDKKFNYLSLNNKGKPSKFIFLNYKTDKQFGRQEFLVPRGLSARFVALMSTAGLGNGDFLFGKSKTEAYASFSACVAKVFKKYTGKSISVNILRHSYVTKFLDKQRTLGERKALADQMAHSVLTQLKYNRI